MRPFLPNLILGAFLGFIVGVLAWTGLPFFGLDLPRVGFYAFVAVAVAGGSFIGSLNGPMLRWMREWRVRSEPSVLRSASLARFYLSRIRPRVRSWEYL